jgi:AraC-like DNA-binding protein
VLQPYLIGELEGWSQSRGTTARLREVPFPGVPLIFNLGAPWQIVHAVEDGRRDRHDSFVAGLHTAPSFVRGENGSWACIELRLTPLGARRLLGRPMHELTNRTLELPELLPQSHELLERLRELDAWADRFALVEAFLARRFAESGTLAPGVEWSWRWLYRSKGRAPITAIATELGWSHRRLIARFRDHLGLTPKQFARIVRFDRAVQSLHRTPRPSLAGVAHDCGYCDQAHMNRDFRELAGTTPAALVAARNDTGSLAA